MTRRKPRPYARRVELSDAERSTLDELMTAGSLPARVFKRARILQLLSDDWAPSDVPAAVGVGEATVRRTRQRYEAGGLDAALYDRPRGIPPRALTKRQEEMIVAMVCASPPQGYARWTIRLVAEQAVRRRIVQSVGRETVRVLLRDHELKPWREKNVVRR